MNSSERMVIYRVLGFFALLIFLALFFRRCWNKAESDSSNMEPVIRHDTAWLPQKDSIVYVPKPGKIEYLEGEVMYDTIIVPGLGVKIDSQMTFRQYFARRTYSDTQHVQYGTIIINDTVTQNRIAKRGVISKLNIPFVTTTIIENEKKRNVWYFGMEGLGNKESIVFSVGASLGIKFKNDKYYGVKAMMTKEGVPLYGFEFKLPIRFSKR